jgi:hypothetical protein
MKQRRVIQHEGTFKLAVIGRGELLLYRNRTRLRTSHDERADTVYGAGEVWEGVLHEGDLIEADGDLDYLLVFVI